MLVLATCLLILTRFNFPYESSPALASLQTNLAMNQPSPRQSQLMPQIIGHRGAGLAATIGEGLIGNTASAIQAGIDAGADWIEIDVRRSRDGVLMVFHDDTVDRTTDGTGKLDQLSKDQLQALQINVQPAGGSIATLREVFDLFSKQDARFILDIKVPGVKNELLPLAVEYLSQDRVILFGVYDVLREYIGSGYSLGYTALWSERWNRYQFLFGHAFILERCDRLGCDYLVLPQVFLNQSLVDEARAKGVDVWTYGSEDKRDWRKSTKRGISGLIVDKPANAVDTFASP